jgi:hypothetical protein
MISIKKIGRSSKVLISLFVLFRLHGCQKEVPLSDFAQYFANYQPELRIEAILDSVNPANSIIRIDRTIQFNDTLLFNGIDEDGDWESFTDLNQNGKWDKGEPLNDDLGQDGHAGNDAGFPARDKGEGNGKPDRGEPDVDETDEILPLLHDSTATVQIIHINSGEVISFSWQTNADSFEVTDYSKQLADQEFEIITEYYGAYRPQQNPAPTLNFDEEYLLWIESPRFGQTITARTILRQPVTFIDTLTTKNGDTLLIDFKKPSGIFWSSDIRCSTYYLTMRQIHRPDSMTVQYEHPSFPIERFNDLAPGQLVGFEPIISLLTPGLFQFTVSALNEDYGTYYLSSLPMKDPTKSNLRDQHGNVVLGAFGAVAHNHIYIRIK